ncbi:hypothetical protein AHAS_Ahas17G0236300 [Arachis hypogaea]
MVSFIQKTRASIKNLEVQIGQLATKVNEIDQRTTNSLPGNTIPNLREECKAITLISKQVAGMEAQVTEEPVEKEALEQTEDTVVHAPPRRADNPFLVSLDTHPTLPKAPEYNSKMPDERIFYTLSGIVFSIYFLAEIEGPEQKSYSEAEKGLQMLLDSDLPAFEVDFLELQKPNWHALNCVRK